MIYVTVSDKDNIGLHNVLSYTRSMLACSDTVYATVTVCMEDSTKSITVHLTKQENGHITERFTFYSADV